MAPIRVLQVVTVMNRGGLETMLMNYYRQMDRSRIQFDFMVHRAEAGHYDEEIRKLGGRIYAMPAIRPGHYRSYFRRLHEFFALHAPDYRVVHSHINENSSFVLRAAKEAGIPCRIAHSHLSDLKLDLKLPFRIYARYMMKDAPNRYFACSKKAGEWLFGRKRGENHNIKVLHNAVHLDDFTPDEAVRRKIREELGTGDGLVIGHIGRFNPQKNHDFVIDVFHAVHQREPNALLLLAGEGHLEPQIRRKVERLGLTKHVQFLGVRTDVARLMQAMDIFLFPSLFEGLPVVLVEAQAAGLRCVVSDAITRETDVSGRVDFMSLDQSPQTWAEKLLTATYEHADTSESLRKHGYDALSMADWLTGFYETEARASGNRKEAVR